MNKIQELEKADKELAEINLRIEQLRYNINALEQNIALLNSLKIQLSQNISILKERKTIAVASEYKKAKTDLNTVRNRMALLQIDLSNSNVAFERAKNLLYETKKLYAMMLKNHANVVIQGNFGKQDGQE